MFGMDNYIFKTHKTTVAFAWILRIFLISFGIYEIFFGYAVFGIIILLAVFLVLLPAILTRQHLFIPLELEILLLIVVLFEYVIADALGFYVTYDYYDKFQHTMIPAVISFMGMLLVYIGYLLDKFRASYPMMWIIIVFVTIGLGATLEVIEYTYDFAIGPATNFIFSKGMLTQGSAVFDAYHDTMIDMIFDIAGAIIGATFGVWLLLRHEKDKKPLLLEDEVEAMRKYRNRNNK